MILAVQQTEHKSGCNWDWFLAEKWWHYVASNYGIGFQLPITMTDGGMNVIGNPRFGHWKCIKSLGNWI